MNYLEQRLAEFLTPSKADTKEAELKLKGLDKAQRLNPKSTEWQQVAPEDVPLVDPDSPQLLGQETRLSGEPGIYPDAPEKAGAKRYTGYVNPETGEVNTEKAARIKAQHDRNFERLFPGIKPSEKDLNTLERVQRENAEEFMNRGEGPVSVRYTGDTAVGGRPVVEVKNALGEDLAEHQAGIENNMAWDSDYNYKQRSRDIAEGKLFSKEYGNTIRPLTRIGADTGIAIAGTAITSTLKTVHEIGDTIGLFSPETAAKQRERIGSIDQFFQQKKSLPLQLQRESYERWQAVRNQDKPYRIEQLMAEKGYTKDQAEIVDMAADAGNTLMLLAKNPTIALDNIANVAGFLVPNVIGGGLIGKFGAKILTRLHAGKLTAADKKLISQLQAATGVAIGALQEGAGSSMDIREKILDTDFETLAQNSEVYRKHLESLGGDQEAARNATADEVALQAFGAAAAVTAVSSAALAKVQISAEAAAGKGFRGMGVSKPVSNTPGSAAARIGLTAGKAAAGNVIEEGVVQEPFAAVLENWLTQKNIDPEQLLSENVGRASAEGATSGAGVSSTIGGVAQTGSEIKRYAREGFDKAPSELPQYEPTEAPKGGGKVKYQPGVSPEELNPKLRGVLENVSQDIQINSGHREGDTGHHGTGSAVDIQISGKSDEEKKDLVRQLYRNGATRFITYGDSGHMHVDVADTHGRFHAMHTPPGNKKAGSAKYMDQAPDWFKEVVAEIQGGQVSEAPVAPKGYSPDAGVPDTPEAQAINTGINQAVDKYGLPPIAAALLKAVTDIESDWGQNTVGQAIGSEVSGDMAHAGERAQGPFQFMPATARQYGLIDPNDPVAAADAAARHMIDAYKIQKKLNPGLSERELWHRAALGHHSGPSFRKLGKNGRDYDAKLKERVGKYLGEGYREVTDRNLVQDSYKSTQQSTATLNPQDIDNGTVSVNEDAARELEELSSYEEKDADYYRKRPDELAKYRLAATNRVAELIEEIKKNPNRKTELVKQVNAITGKVGEIKRAVFSSEAADTIARVEKSLGSTSSPDVEITPPEKNSIIQAAINGDLSEEQIETLRKVPVDQLGEKAKSFIENLQEVGERANSSTVGAEKFGWISESLSEFGSIKLGMSGHLERIANLMDYAENAGDDAKAAPITNALNSLNAFVDSQYKKTEAMKDALDKAEAAGEETVKGLDGKPRPIATHRKFVQTLIEEQKVLDDAFQAAVATYNFETLPNILEAKPDAKYKTYEIAARKGNLKTDKSKQKQGKGGKPTPEYEAAKEERRKKKEERKAKKAAQIDNKKAQADAKALQNTFGGTVTVADAIKARNLANELDVALPTAYDLLKKQTEGKPEAEPAPKKEQTPSGNQQQQSPPNRGSDKEGRVKNIIKRLKERGTDLDKLEYPEGLEGLKLYIKSKLITDKEIIKKEKGIVETVNKKLGTSVFYVDEEFIDSEKFLEIDPGNLVNMLSYGAYATQFKISSKDVAILLSADVSGPNIRFQDLMHELGHAIDFTHIENLNKNDKLLRQLKADYTAYLKSLDETPPWKSLDNVLFGDKLHRLGNRTEGQLDDIKWIRSFDEWKAESIAQWIIALETNPDAGKDQKLGLVQQYFHNVAQGFIDLWNEVIRNKIQKPKSIDEWMRGLYGLEAKPLELNEVPFEGPPSNEGLPPTEEPSPGYNELPPDDELPPDFEGDLRFADYEGFGPGEEPGATPRTNKQDLKAQVEAARKIEIDEDGQPVRVVDKISEIDQSIAELQALLDECK